MKTFISCSMAVSCLMILSTGLFAQGIDWGDAPDPSYPTLGANNGAHHVILPGMFLGTYVDAENDGQINIGMARGDDLNAQDDADGIIFNNWLLPGQPCNITVMASMPGVLNAWLDFNADGDWLDAGEQIFTDAQLLPGNNYLVLNIPATIPSGLPTYARFRFSSIAGLSFTGMAPDGEVEDYQVMLDLPPMGEIFIDPDPTQLFTQNEISLAIMPGTQFGPPPLMVAAYNDEPFPGGPGIGISYSSDVGGTWGSTHLPMPVSNITGVPLLDAFDPSVTIDGDGNVYAAQIATDANWWTGPVTGLFVHKSTNGGQTWPTYTPVDEQPAPTGGTDTAYRLNDRDQIICDRYSSSPYHNNLYIAWIQDRGWNMPTPSSDIYFSYSSDGGLNFSPAHRINSWANNLGNMPTLDVGKDGTIYVAWMDYNVQTGGQGIIFLDKSTDGGISWGPDIPVDTIDLPPLHLNMNTGVRAKGAPVVRVLPSDPNHVFIVFAEDPDAQGPDEADIFIRASTDGGMTWPIQNKVRVNDDATASDQILPWVAIKRNDIIDIAWYDKRNDVNDGIFDVYFAYSTDKGMSFAPNMQVNQMPFYAPFVPKTGDFWFGEYLALATDYFDAFIIHTTSNYDQLGDVIFAPTPNPEPYKDWGDAPDPSFPVLSLNTAASHIYVPGIYLGSQVDLEPDGIPHASAMGDDNYNTSDEDGVIMPSPLLIGQLDTIEVTASTAGYLNAWIDYNGNGTWADPGDQIYTDQMLNLGLNRLAIMIPGGIGEITTFARFRFSTMAGLSFTGEAPDGEVEDYLVVLDDQTGLDSPEGSGMGLEIIPNPASGIVRCKIQDSRLKMITVVDLMGSVVTIKSYTNNEEIIIDVGELPDGLYILRAQAGNRIAHRKLLVVN